MRTVESRFDVSDVEVSNSGLEAALKVVARLTREKDDLARQWATAMRLAQANGASLRDIARVANVSPQTVANRAEGVGGK